MAPNNTDNNSNTNKANAAAKNKNSDKGKAADNNSNSADRILERHEIPDEYKWDLFKLYPSDKEWEKGLKDLEARIEGVQQFQGTLEQSVAQLKQCLDYLNDTEKLEERLGYYAHLRTTENVGSSEHQERFARYMQVATRLSAATSYFTPEIQSIPDQTMEQYLAAPELDNYNIMLRKLLRFKPHILSQKEEKLLALQAEARQAPEKAFSSLTNVDFDFGSITTPEGPKPLSQSTFSSFMINPSRQVRRSAYERFYEVYSGHKHSLAALYDGSVQDDIYRSRVRGYESARQMALFPDKVPESVYDNLINVVHENLPALHRYYDLRRRALELDTLSHYDVYVPIVPEIKTNYPYDQAVDTVIEALHPLGEEYQNTLRKGLLGSWVDRYENKGKRSGAFSAGSYVGDPYILLNYKEDVLRDVFTLAHEGGHSMHSWYSARNNPFPHYNYTIFEAEVASTFNEQLLADHLLEHADNPRMQAYIINKLVDDFVATIFRQTMFAEFEHQAHHMVEKGRPLTVDSIRATYRDLLTRYFGPDVHLPEPADIECLRIPHFYRAFYVYKYATGLSAAVSLSTRVTSGGPQERNDYLAFLKSGGSRYPLESLQLAGVDMSSPEPIRTAMQNFRERLTQLEQLIM